MYVSPGEGYKEIFPCLLLLFLADFSLATITGYSVTVGNPSAGPSGPSPYCPLRTPLRARKGTDQSSRVAQ